jgi:hypothetical protein
MWVHVGMLRVFRYVCVHLRLCLWRGVTNCVERCESVGGVKLSFIHVLCVLVGRMRLS